MEEWGSEGFALVTRYFYGTFWGRIFRRFQPQNFSARMPGVLGLNISRLNLQGTSHAVARLRNLSAQRRRVLRQ